MRKTRLVVNGKEVVRFSANNSTDAYQWLLDNGYKNYFSDNYIGIWDFSDESDIDFECRVRMEG